MCAVPVVLAGRLAFVIVSRKTNLKATSFHGHVQRCFRYYTEILLRVGTPALHTFAQNLPSNPARIFLFVYPKGETDSSIRLLNTA